MAVETAPRAAQPAAPAEMPGGNGAAASDDEATPTPADTETLHPLIDRLSSESPDEVVYSTDFAASRHWVLDEHRIMGNPAVPGTTYLELARAAFAHHAGTGADDAIEIRDVFFFQPLMMQEGETKEARVTLKRSAGDLWELGIGSRGAGEETWTEHTRGKVGMGAGAVESFDLEAIRKRCTREIEINTEELGNKDFVYWGPRWQSLEQADVGDGEGLARLRLPAEFAGDLEGLPLHPALVDVATALISGLTEGDNYLPLSYHKVTVRERLPATLYSYLRLHDDAGAGETIKGDISLLDEEGRELVAIEGFTMKRVGAARSRLAETESASDGQGAPPKTDTPAAGMFAEGGMLPAEGVEVLRRVLSRVHQPRIVVSPRDLAGMEEQLADSRSETSAEGVPARPANESRSKHPRPHLSTPYAPPTGDVETRLAEIWQNVLALEEVGVHDNFFDLGGDSVMGITVISEAAEAGLELAPEHLFEHQTIAELAELLGGEPSAAGTASDLALAEDTDGKHDAELAPDELEKILAQLDEIEDIA